MYNWGRITAGSHHTVFIVTQTFVVLTNSCIWTVCFVQWRWYGTKVLHVDVFSNYSDLGVHPKYLMSKKKKNGTEKAWKISKSKHAITSNGWTRVCPYNTPVNRVTLVTQAYSLQKEMQRRRKGGEAWKGKWKGGKNYYHPLPSLLIKIITSNMFLMTVKAGGNWFIWRCFKVNFSQVERGSLKWCGCV